MRRTRCREKGKSRKKIQRRKSRRWREEMKYRKRIRKRKRRRWKQQSMGGHRNYHHLNVPNCPSSLRREIGGDATDVSV